MGSNSHKVWLEGGKAKYTVKLQEH